MIGDWVPYIVGKPTVYDGLDRISFSRLKELKGFKCTYLMNTLEGITMFEGRIAWDYMNNHPLLARKGEVTSYLFDERHSDEEDGPIPMSIFDVVIINGEDYVIEPSLEEMDSWPENSQDF